MTSIGLFELFAEAAKIHPDFHIFERLWWAWYEWWQSDIVATALLTFWMHEFVYFGRCVPWMIADALPQYFLKYKIQHQKQPSKQTQWECTCLVLLIHFTIEMPLIIGFHPITNLFGCSVTTPFPSSTEILLQTILFFFVEDAYHYWVHRFLHWGPMYRKVHRIHHQYSAPFGLAAEYASPWETLILGMGTVGAPLAFSVITGRLHLATVIFWVTLRQFQAIDSHSGYDFPWSLRHWLPIWGGSDWHDAHHKYFIGNYSSSFRFWDIWMGTEAGPEAGAKRRAKRHLKIEKALPARKQSPATVSAHFRDASSSKWE